MLVFIDDGSTNIKLQWQESDGTIKQHISPNSFKREWAVSFGDKKVFNYTLNGEQYSFDPISPDAVVTTALVQRKLLISSVLPAPRFIKFLKTKGPRDTPIFIG